MKKQSINWISEKQAAEMLGYKPSSLRRYVLDEKRKKLFINTTRLNRKTILYSKTDIENYILENSTLIA